MSTDYVKMLKRSDKLPIYTDLDTLDIYCEYLLNDRNRHINYSNLTNLRDYILLFDEATFKTNDAKMARYFFIKYYLEGKLDKGIINRKLCINYVRDHVSKKYFAIIKREILDSIESDSLQKKDIEFVNSMIFTQLNIAFLHDYKGPMMKMLEDLNNNEFGKDSGDCDNAIRLFQAIVNDLSKAQRRSRQENRFNLSDPEHFKAVMTEACDRLLSDSQYWQTGWQGLNKMLNGGVEDARIYNFIGATGGFKSGLLLNLMKQIKMYNKGRQHKDPTKRPTILFLSQENNIWETILRIFGIFGTTDNIKKFSAKEIMNILSNGGFTVVQDDEDIDIEFRYYGNMDIGVSDIRGICEELDNSGREVICVIQDYIERLRPPVMTAERRVQLFDISNQLHDLAIELDIPIITGSQFNRTGVATIEDLQNANKKDVGMNVGSKDVSESFGMLKNFDVNIAIVVEYDSQEERFYLSFRLLKFRGDDTDSIRYFLQPFVGKNSKIQLMDDLYTEPLYRTSMTDELEARIANDAMQIKEITRRQVKSIVDPVIDIDEVDTMEFFDKVGKDIDKSSADQVDDFIRDEDGFIILVPNLNLTTLPIVGSHR